MLWYKVWLETRWRFLIGLALVICSAAGLVFAYPRVLTLMPLVSTINVNTELGRRILEQAELSRDYRGYVWVQGFRQNLTQMVTVFAVLLGTGGLLSHSSGTLFTLSMPVSRRDLVGVRALTGLTELFVLAAAPAIVFPMFSPAIGESYSFVSASIHALCLFAAAAVFFSFTVLLSTVFLDIWRPLLIALGVALAVGIAEGFAREFSRYGIFGLMSGEIYFRTGALPWVALVATGVVSAVLLYFAAVNMERHDF
jgi:hypothetical protein